MVGLKDIEGFFQPKWFCDLRTGEHWKPQIFRNDILKEYISKDMEVEWNMRWGEERE